LTGSPALSIDPADTRAAQACQWACRALHLSQASFAPASADASFRRYFRLAADSDFG